MTNLDRLVTAFRRWVEDRLPWYDRGAEQKAIARTEGIRRRSVDARMRAEQVQEPDDEQLASYRRARVGR